MMDIFNKTAIVATLHCLVGCAIGEVVGMVIGTALNSSNLITIVLSILLAFIFGMSLTMRSLLSHGMTFRAAVPIVIAVDALSITVMEIADNGVIVLIPGALTATLTDTLFWLSLVFSLAVAFVAAVPVNGYLIRRGKGHALVHEHHH